MPRASNPLKEGVDVGLVSPVPKDALKEWFRAEVLPLESALTAFIKRNWRNSEEVIDLRQEIYERALIGASRGLPYRTSGYIYAIARNHMANHARRARIVSIHNVSDIDAEAPTQAIQPEPALIARDELRRAMVGLERLPRRCRDVVRLRKFEGLSTLEVAEQMGVTIHTVEKQLTLGMRALTDFMLGGSGKIERPNRAE